MPRHEIIRWGPLTVRLPNGIPRIFSDVGDALHFLGQDWPSQGGVKYHRALEACRLALAHRGSLARAKFEFQLACIEAGMFPIATRRHAKANDPCGDNDLLR